MTLGVNSKVELQALSSYKNNEIEENAKEYGYKAANLQELMLLAKRFKETDEYKTLVELYGEIEIDVPAFQPISSSVIISHLDQHTLNWCDLWKKFKTTFAEQKDQNTLGEASIQCLKDLQTVIVNCFSNNLVSEELYGQFLQDNEIKPDDLLMVRSSGIHEDKADMANPGGNESLPCRATREEISKALGQVIASYVGVKSLSQRLINSQDPKSITEVPVMPGLLQIMVGEGINAQEDRQLGRDDIYSGVIYTTMQGSSRMQAAYGHGEYVVNSKGLVDNLYISTEGLIYQEICPKEQRLKPEIIDQKVSLEWVKNNLKLKYSPTIDAKKEMPFLHEFSQYVEKQYGRRMDIEFAGRRSEDIVGNKKIELSIVQARIIPEGSRKGLIPSALSPAFLAENNLQFIKGLQVITPEVNRAALLTGRKQMIISNTINEALSQYNALGKDSGIKAVIVQEPAPDTSHEAGVFHSNAIPVMQVKDIAVVEKLLKNNAEEFLIIDPQRGKIYQLPNKLLPANIEENIEDALYEAKILQDGVFASTLTSHVDIVAYEFSKVLGKTSKDPVTTETALQNKSYGTLIAEAELGNVESADQTFSIAYKPMEYKKSAVKKENVGEQDDILEDKAQKLRDNLEALSTPKLGRDNDSVRRALDYVTTLMAFYADVNNINSPAFQPLISTDLEKQIALVGGNLEVLLDKMAKLSPEQLSQKEQDENYLEYFNVLKKFEGLITGKGDSLVTQLQANKYKKLAEKLNSKITGDAKEILIDSLKLGDYLISKEEKAQWYKFCATVCVKEEFAQNLGYLIKELVSYQAHKQWINVIFTQVNDPENPKPTLATLTKDFATVDLEKINQATNLIGRMEGEISEWSNPNKFNNLYKNLQQNLTEINKNLQWNKQASNLEQILITQPVHKLTDIIDKSAKSLERFGEYKQTMKDHKGNDLQVARFFQILTQFHNLMEIWTENVEFKDVDQLRVKERLTAMRQFLKQKAEMILTKAELSPSPNFAVNRATIDIKGTVPEPKTLEDFLTLCHQNILVALNHLTKDINKIIEQQCPPLVQKLNDQLNNEITASNYFKNLIKPSTSIEFKDGGELYITKNFSLRSHALIVNMNIPNTGPISFSFSMFGDNEFNRWDNITLDNTLAGFNSYFDQQKDIVRSERNIDNEQQIDEVITVINQSIATSYALAGALKGVFGIVAPTKTATTAMRELVHQRLNSIDTLLVQQPDSQSKLNNLQFIPNLPITRLEFQDIQADISGKDSFILNNIINIIYLNKAGLHPQELLKLRDLHFKKAQFLATNGSEVLRLSKLGLPLDEFLKIYDTDKKEAAYLVKYSPNIEKDLLESGFPSQEWFTLRKEDPENAQYLISKCYALKELYEDGVSAKDWFELHKSKPDVADLLLTNRKRAINWLFQVCDSSDEWFTVCSNKTKLTQLLMIESQYVLNLLFKSGVSPTEWFEIYNKNEHQKNDHKKAEFLIKNVPAINALYEAGFSYKKLWKLHKTDYKAAEFLMESSVKIRDLVTAGFSLEKWFEIRESGPTEADFLLQKSKEIKVLSEAGFSADKWFKIRESGPTEADFLLQKSKEIKVLSEAGFSTDKWFKIHESDPTEADFLLQKSKEIKVLSEAGFSLEKWFEIRESDPTEADFLLQKSEAIKVLSDVGISADKWFTIREADSPASEFLVQHCQQIKDLFA